MIIKHKTLAKQCESWRFFEGVTDVYTSRYTKKVLSKELPNWKHPAEVTQYENWKSDTSDNYVIFCSFISETLGPVHLIFDTEGYLMTDSGKTIERLL